MFTVLFFCFIFYVIFGIISLFVYIIFKFLKFIFNCIIGTNKHKEEYDKRIEEYDKRILSKAISKVFLNCIEKNISKKILYTNDIISIFSNKIYKYIDDEMIINSEIKKCFKDNILFLYNIAYPKYEYYGFNYEEYKINCFKRTIDNIIDNLDYKIDEILSEYSLLKNIH